MNTRNLSMPLAVVAALVVWITPAEASPIQVASLDDPSQDRLDANGLYEEIGEYSVFPEGEQLESHWGYTLYRPCLEQPDSPDFPNVEIGIANLTGRDLHDVHYVADWDSYHTNFDGHISNAGMADWSYAFRIDNFGKNTPLVFESLSYDNIWQANELWAFVIQDFYSGWGGPPAPFDSLGIASISYGSPSTGSIIALPIPEPSTFILLGMGALGSAFYGLRRRITFCRRFALLVALACGLVLGAVSQADAEIYTYQIAGTIESSSLRDVHAEDPFTGWFAYASDMAYDSSGSGTIRYVQNPPSSPLGVFLIVNSLTFATPSQAPVYLDIKNDPPGGYDTFDLKAYWTHQESSESIDLYLADSSGTAFQYVGNTIPLSLALDWFDSDKRTVGFYRVEGFFTGNITSMTRVPEPSTCVLLGIGAFGVLFSGRRGNRTAREAHQRTVNAPLSACLFVLATMSLLSTNALADYVYPLTFDPQRTLDWEFNALGNYLDPITVVGPTWNGPGWECDDVTVTGPFQWYALADVWPNHRGLIGIDNSTGTETLEGTITFHINNYDNINPEKRLYFEALCYANGGGTGVAFGVPPEYEWDSVVGGVDPLPDGGQLYHFEHIVNPNPPWEEVFFFYSAPPGVEIYLDSFQVSTLCIPEPGTLALLGMGASLLLGVGLRRRS